jgi:hypothetical protein
VVRKLPDVVLVVVVVELLLVGVGLVRTPSALTAGSGALAVAGVALAQIGCVVAARWGPVSARRSPPAAVAVGVVVGAITGGLYAAEVLAEYLSPAVTRANIAIGYVIIAAIVASGCVAGALGALRGGTWRGGLVSAAWNAIAEYLVWYPAVLACYYLFSGDTALERVLRAEGTYDDFHRSGMSDLDAFLLQDFFGAGLFHLLAGVVLAMLVGSVAAAIARTARRAAGSATEHVHRP